MIHNKIAGYILGFVFVLLANVVFIYDLKAQTNNLSGLVLDETQSNLAYATVALLDTGDSTLVYYGISNNNGIFTIKNIKAGRYLLQTAFLGYETFYKTIDIPGTGSDFGAIQLRKKAVELDEAVIDAERIPLLIKKDTIEYDAAAFKTKPDAAVEDLLKKLPGVEVDRSGNIKAQGENVRNVLVDGKEFFGNDPKIATKNLPADAIDKVQVYDKKSEDAELTGVDDGIRAKTVNLLLKENKKSAWLGDVSAGIGTDEHYQGSAKIYRFTKNNQFATLGMLNDINQFGFSFQDYIDFSGGFRAFSNGDGNLDLKINDDSNFPINFGQAVNGLIRSGAFGVNFSNENDKKDRIAVSYMGNGTDKKLDQITSTTNYTDLNTFLVSDTLFEKNKNYNHRLNLSGRKKINRRQDLLMNGSVVLRNADSYAEFMTTGKQANAPVNFLSSSKQNSADGYDLNAALSYLLKGDGKWKLLRIGTLVRSSRKEQNSAWENLTTYYLPNSQVSESRYLLTTEQMHNYSADVSVTRSIGEKAYLIPGIKAGYQSETTDKELGIPESENIAIDSLTGKLQNTYSWFRPALTFRRNTGQTRMTFSAQIETGARSSQASATRRTEQRIFYFTPQFSWDNEYRKGRHLNVSYESFVNVPEASQLNPISSGSNSVERFNGNMDLKAEYIQALHLHSMIFDQFSFTSIFTGINFQYTRDKINWKRDVDEQLNQVMTLTNVKEDYNAGSNVEFSTPIRKLKVNVSIDWQEKWNRGISIINNTENINTNFEHSFSLKLDNRKKEKWDVEIGAGINYSQVKYSIGNELDNNYLSINYFIDASYTPSDKWHINFSAEITEYQNEGFQNKYTVPFLQASVSRYLLKNGRLVIGLELNDILDKNTGISRISELNYLREQRSNTIGRFLMLNLKFRLNKFSKGTANKINIDIK